MLEESPAMSLCLVSYPASIEDKVLRLGVWRLQRGRDHECREAGVTEDEIVAYQLALERKPCSR
jgi:hypothetical protein